MEQNKSKTTTKTTYLARPRTLSTSNSLPVPAVKLVIPTITPLTATSATTSMSYSSHNHRPLSPGGRRLHNSNRMSDQGLSDYYPTTSSSRHSTNSYANPRHSTGVVPISTQTFINVPPPTSSRPVTQYDSYSGRPRRSSLVDTQRGTTASGSGTQSAPRIRPNIIQTEVVRPASPIKLPREKDYYVTPAVSQEPRITHKKLYSVDDTGAKLVADVNVNVPSGGERHHKRRDSVERTTNYRSSGNDRERDRGRRGYHVNGTANRPRDKSIDDEDAYSYTDPASMYRDTEPRWREVRPRRGSVDRGGATSRERPVSVLDPTFGLRQPAKEVGPPPSTRGWDKINENLGRTRSVRDEPSTRQHVAQSPTRGRTYPEPVTYVDARDPYYVAPRTNSTDRRTTVHQYDYGYEEPKEVRRGRKHSVTRDGRPDQSVERRGFGIRAEPSNQGHLRADSQNRYGRGSDESFDAQKYRDSAYVEPHRRDTAPEPYQHEVLRAEQEKKDRDVALRMQAEERDRHRERDVPREKRRDDDRTGYDREYERSSKRDRSREREQEREKERERDREREREKDRERERERVRVVDPPADRDRERHHHRRDTDRDRDYKKDNSPRQSTDTVSKPSLSQAATGGLAGAAAAFGLTGLLNKVTDKQRDKDRDDAKDREREKEKDRERERERERKERREKDDDRTADRRKADDRDRSPQRERRPGKAASDEEPRDRDMDRDRPRDVDRGLGFAFEQPEPPRSAPLTNSQEWKPDRMRDDRAAEKRDVPAPERVTERPPPSIQDRVPEKQATFERQPERKSTLERERQPVYAQDRDADRDREIESKAAEMPAPAIDADEDYRRRMEQVQRELGVQRDALRNDDRGSDSDPDRARRRREREQRLRERGSRTGGGAAVAGATDLSNSAELPSRRSLERDSDTASFSIPDTNQPALRRRPSVLDQPMSMNDPVQIIDNSQSEKRENRVRIVDPPTEAEEERRPKGILKRPTQKFPEDPNNIREGVAPLKDATKKGIPPGARWTKIDRRLVNPEALEAAQERFEERLDCVIVLRVLTKEEIQKLADKTRGIRGG